MSYINDICQPLIETLERSAKLPTHQLAGHAANLQFWMDEAKHCLDVIDGYNQRFERMKNAQSLQTQTGNESERPLQRGVKDKERTELRRKVEIAADRFLERCHVENLIEENVLQEQKRNFS